MLHMQAALGHPEGRAPLVRASASAHAITLEQANQLGEGVAAQLRANGAG